jgi:Uma2 family endonuclease
VATATKKPWTADELCRLPKGWRYEIEHGELVIMSPAGGRHGYVAMNIGSALREFVRSHRLGTVLGGETGVYTQREPLETLRGLDVVFYAGDRGLRAARTTGFLDFPPDLAVEVHDPSEPDLRRKVAEYLAAGVRAVWVVDPVAGSLTRHAPNESPRAWSNPDDLVEEPVVPGFTCRLRDLFE